MRDLEHKSELEEMQKQEALSQLRPAAFTSQGFYRKPQSKMKSNESVPSLGFSPKHPCNSTMIGVEDQQSLDRNSSIERAQLDIDMKPMASIKLLDQIYYDPQSVYNDFCAQ